MAKPTLAIDLDGTLLTDSWPKLGEWMPGALEALHYLKNHAKIVVHTCRIASDDPGGHAREPGRVQMEINAIREKLDDAGLYTVDIWTKPYKPPAVAYVDNRGIRYTGRKNSWKALTPKLLNIVGAFEEAMTADEASEVHE